MNSPTIQLLVLAAIAVFLLLKLKNVLGTREGFEKPRIQMPDATPERKTHKFEVIEGGPDLDITDHVPADSTAAKALAAMKGAEPGFQVSEFLGGARGAYEMILMAFEKGDMDSIVPFLSKEVFEAFSQVVDARHGQGLIIETNFIGVSETTLVDAEFDASSGQGEISVRFIGELTSVVRDKAGDIIEGNAKEVKRQKDVWTFARAMGSDDANWTLVATEE